MVFDLSQNEKKRIFARPFFACPIDDASKIACPKNQRHKINLSTPIKTNVMTCIVYNNILIFHTQKYHKLLTFNIYDFIEIYSFVTNYFFFVLQQAFLSISKISRFILNILVVEEDWQVCGVKFSIKLVSINSPLIHLRRASIVAAW